MALNYCVYVPNAPRKSLKKIPLPWQVRILDVLTTLKNNPYLGDKMQGEYSDRRKIRVWPYRIIYMVYEDAKIIRIMEIKRRGDVSYD